MEIKRFSPKSHKIKALIYGPSGSGKTSFGGTAKNVLFASAENGLLSIADKNVAYSEIKSLDDLLEIKDFLEKGEHEFETLVIDSITEINDIIKKGIEKRTGKMMQIQDWGELANKIEGIIKDIKDIDINVIVIAQELNIQDDNKIQRIVPSLNGKSSTKICYYMDIVGYIYVDKTGARKIITNTSEKLLTKDRTGKIGNDTALDFMDWIKLVSEIETIGDEEVLYKTMSADEVREQERKLVFESHKKALELCEDMDMLKKVFLAVNKDKLKITTEQLKELSKIKDDMKTEIGNPKEEKVVEETTKKETKKATKKATKK